MHGLNDGVLVLRIRNDEQWDALGKSLGRGRGMHSEVPD